MSIATVQRDSPAQENAIWATSAERGRRAARRGTKRGWRLGNTQICLRASRRENWCRESRDRAPGMGWGQRAHPESQGLLSHGFCIPALSELKRKRSSPSNSAASFPLLVSGLDLNPHMNRMVT